MSDTDAMHTVSGAAQANSTGAAGTGSGSAAPTIPLFLNTQYVRSMAFQVPGAPAIYAAMQNIRPHITLGIDVQVRQSEDRQPTWEVVLLLHCTGHVSKPVPGETPPAIAFLAEIAYAGIFTLQNVAADAVEPILFAECPRLLFPFARAQLADITREAGFPPVLLQPFDFITFWQGKRAAAAAERAAQPAV